MRDVGCRRCEEGTGPDILREIDAAPEQTRAAPESGSLFWLPGPPADPENPTMADLERGVDLTPYVVSFELAAGGPSALETNARQQLLAEVAMVEQAVEVALQQGRCGVRVWRHDGGVTVRVDPSVPYGHIYETPGKPPPN